MRLSARLLTLPGPCLGFFEGLRQGGRERIVEQPRRFVDAFHVGFEHLQALLEELVRALGGRMLRDVGDDQAPFVQVDLDAGVIELVVFLVHEGERLAALEGDDQVDPRPGHHDRRPARRLTTRLAGDRHLDLSRRVVGGPAQAHRRQVVALGKLRRNGGVPGRQQRVVVQSIDIALRPLAQRLETFGQAHVTPSAPSFVQSRCQSIARRARARAGRAGKKAGRRAELQVETPIQSPR